VNLFSRIFTVAVCLKLAALAVAIVVLAWTIPTESIDALRDAVDWLQEHNQDTEKALLTTIGGLDVFVILVIIAFELVPGSAREVKVTDLKVGDAVLSTASISQRVEEAVRRVPHVADVRAPVRAKRKGVVLTLDMYVDPEANLATVSDEACQAATDVLTERVHVSLAQPPHVRLHYRELRLRGRPTGRQPSTPQTPPAEPPSPPETPTPHLVRQTVDPSVGHAASGASEAPAAIATAEPETAPGGDEPAEGKPQA
jgi:hypothetical protein